MCPPSFLIYDDMLVFRKLFCRIHEKETIEVRRGNELLLNVFCYIVVDNSSRTRHNLCINNDVFIPWQPASGEEYLADRPEVLPRQRMHVWAAG